MVESVYMTFLIFLAITIPVGIALIEYHTKLREKRILQKLEIFDMYYTAMHNREKDIDTVMKDLL